MNHRESDEDEKVKTCKTCGLEKSIEKYEGARRECKSCRDRRRRLRQYGLTLERFDDILREQGGACAICRFTIGPTSIPGEVSAWRIDHDHACCPGAKTCGRCLRGLLCHNCNISLGNVRDNLTTLKNMIHYLEESRG